jgi:hypothetical protein
VIHFAEISEDILLNMTNKKPGGILIILSKTQAKRNNIEIWKGIAQLIGIKIINPSFIIVSRIKNYSIPSLLLFRR